MRRGQLAGPAPCSELASATNLPLLLCCSLSSGPDRRQAGPRETAAAEVRSEAPPASQQPVSQPASRGNLESRAGIVKRECALDQTVSTAQSQNRKLLENTSPRFNRASDIWDNKNYKYIFEF